MQDNSTQKSNAARSSRMKARLIETARELFAAQGYSETSTPQIVKIAGVTRGALYHHFSDKKGLFRAVIEGEAEQVAHQIKTSSPIETTARQALVDGSLAYFEAISVPGRAELLLIEGPSVLGLVEMAEIDALTSGDDLKNGLDHAVKQGELQPVPTRELSDILSAAFDRAALSCLNKPSRKQSYKRAIDQLISSLFDAN